MALEIRKLLVVSTANISPATAAWLDAHDPRTEWPVCGGHYGPYGWTFYCCESNDGEGARHIPDDLFAVLQFARAHGCDNLLIDRDGEQEVDGLPSHAAEWDTAPADPPPRELSPAQKNLAKLPARCAAFLIEDGTPIMILAGTAGYWKAAPFLDVVAYNEGKGITHAQVAAMMAGSAFGWEVPAADCDAPSNTAPTNLYTSFLAKRGG